MKINLKKLIGTLGVVAGIVTSPAVLDLFSAKVAGVVVAAAYLIKTLIGNDNPER